MIRAFQIACARSTVAAVALAGLAGCGGPAEGPTDGVAEPPYQPPADAARIESRRVFSGLLDMRAADRMEIVSIDGKAPPGQIERDVLRNTVVANMSPAYHLVAFRYGVPHCVTTLGQEATVLLFDIPFDTTSAGRSGRTVYDTARDSIGFQARGNGSYRLVGERAGDTVYVAVVDSGTGKAVTPTLRKYLQSALPRH